MFLYVPGYTFEEALELNTVLAAQHTGDEGIFPLVIKNNEQVISVVGGGTGFCAA